MPPPRDRLVAAKRVEPGGDAGGQQGGGVGVELAERGVDVDAEDAAGAEDLGTGRKAASGLPLGDGVTAVAEAPRESELGSGSPEGAEQLAGDIFHVGHREFAHRSAEVRA